MTFPRNIKGGDKGLDIDDFGIVDYSSSSCSGRIVTLWYQAYCIYGIKKYFFIIKPQGICTSEVYKGTFISHLHVENDILSSST